MTSIAETLVQLERRCNEKGDDVAIEETNGRRVTFRDLWRQAENVSANLAARGLCPGDHVLFAVRPRIESIVLIFAIVRAGGVVVALDLGLGPELFASRMRLLRPKWMIAEAPVLALSSSARARALLRRRGATLPDLRALAGCQFVRVGPWLPFGPRALPYVSLAAPAASVRPPELQPEAPAFVVFTSGTTDAPKAVVHTGRSIGATLAIAADHLAMEPHDVVYASELHLVVPALLAGAKTVLPRYRRYDPRRHLRDLERHGITHAFGLPADMQVLVRYCLVHRQKLAPALKTLMLGAAPVYPSLLSRLRDILPAQAAVWCVYAMTEMLPVCAVTLDEKLSVSDGGDLVGRPLPSVCVRVDGGELVVRGPNLFSHYLGESPVSEHRTGDAARIDADGRVVLLGRKKDMIIRGHHNIYPALYEPAIARIAGVRRCALVGLYDDDRQDETVILAVEPDGQPGAGLEQRIQRELRDGPNAIDAAAQPDRIVIMAIPLAGRSQKPDLNILRELIRGRL